MEARYKYGQRPGRRRRTRVLIVFGISFFLIGIVATIIVLDLRKNKDSGSVEGTSRTVVQSGDEATNIATLNDEFFTMDFPSDWKEITKTRTAREHNVSWQATKHGEDNRYIKIYVDSIPPNYAVNRMLPVMASGSGLVIKEISNNCSTFTKGGVAAAGQAQFLQNESARYEGVDFLCDLAQITDNEVGTSSTDGVNIVAVTGPTKGKHTYFFVYVDHNIQPNYNIFYTALKSFRAK